MTTRTFVASGARGLALALILSFAIVSSPAFAQSATDGRVVVAVADSLPVSTAKAIVLFHGTPRGENVVLLSRNNPSAEALGAALRLLTRLEREHKGTPYSAMLPIEGVVASHNFAHSERKALDAVIQEVARQPLTSIAGVGRGRWSSFSRARLATR